MSEDRGERILRGVKKWAAFYRANPQRFASDYLRLHLKLFQKILLVMMNISNFFIYIAARGQGKSFLIAVYCCIRCILYPGSKICIASGTRTQSTNIIEKIKNELLPLSPYLMNEIRNIQISSTIAGVDFYNSSTIKVVTATDSARSNRANILICDEFRLVNLDVINTVLRRFLTAPRMPGYMHKKEYMHLKERNKEIYLSSAFFQDHWSFQKVIDFCRNMMDDERKYFVCGLPYQLSIAEGLLDRSAVEDEMTESDFSEIKFSMEMGAEFFGDGGGTFFDYETVSKNRKIQYPMLPDELSSKLPDAKKVRIPPKEVGEKRLLSVDLALMSSAKNNNDASAVFIDQIIPTKTGRYINNIVYTESSEGEHTQDQALRVRRLYEMYSCDYIVIDSRGVGFGVVDALLRDIPDPERGTIYPALSCCNNPELASRCKDRGAEKAIWAISADGTFNSECAVLLREGFRSGRIRLLVSEYEGESLLNEIKGFKNLQPFDKDVMQIPYVNTTLLISELVRLQHDETSGKIRIKEKSGARKDRYSSLSYAYYVACQLETKIRTKEPVVDFSSETFVFRAPKIK